MADTSQTIVILGYRMLHSELTIAFVVETIHRDAKDFLLKKLINPRNDAEKTTKKGLYSEKSFII